MTWVQKELIDNPHPRLRLALGVDEDFVNSGCCRAEQAGRTRREAMTADDVSKILTQTIALNERPEQDGRLVMSAKGWTRMFRPISFTRDQPLVVL